MSLRINTNMSSLIALRNVQSASDGFSHSIERLASGLRVIRGSDDPAGLIRSENLRAQIAGLEQAIANSQDATNLVKTAEGALEEIHTLLRSMRQLAVHAGNTGTNDLTALQADQNQIRSALESINRIAMQTQFGTKKLLDGTAGVSTAVTNSNLVGGAFFTGVFNGVAVASGDVSIQQITSATRAVVAGSVSYGSLASTVSAGSIVINGQTFSTDGTETLESFLNKINAATSVTGVVAEASFANGSYVIRLRSSEYGANFRVNLDDSRGLVISGGGATNVVGRNAEYTVSINTAAGVTSVKFVGGRSAGESGLRLTDTYGNVILLTEAGNATTNLVQVARITAGQLQFQVGANAGQTVALSLNNMSITQLGTGVVAGKSLADIDVTKTGGADEALRIIDAAIAQVSKLRGDMGAFQRNILESNMRSLSVAKENLTATESSIRDVNFAEEITRFTKFQILQQAGMAVLGQANFAPQAVLQLIR
jgi:flagellin